MVALSCFRSQHVVMLAIMMGFAAGASAQQENGDLPPGEEVLQKAVEATGGEATLGEIKNRRASGTMEIVGMGMQGQIMTVQARPNLAYSEITISGIGTIKQGTNGDVVWETNPLTGPRVITGAERDMHLVLNTFDEAEMEDIITSAKTLGVGDVNGVPCYKLEILIKDLEPMLSWYAVESGLNLKTSLTLETQFGAIETVVLIEDYREIDGILYPYSINQTAMGQEINMQFESVEHNVELADDAFKVPDEVAVLAERTSAEQD